MPIVSGYAVGSRRIPGFRSAPEREYAAYLEDLRREGVILRYWYEQLRWTFESKVHYTPDFMVQFPDGMLEAHEVKGGVRTQSAHNKIKGLYNASPFAVKLIEVSGTRIVTKVPTGDSRVTFKTVDPDVRSDGNGGWSA